MSNMRRTPAWKTVDCPVCGRKAGENCRIELGYQNFHFERMDAAKATQQAARLAKLRADCNAIREVL